MSLRLAAVRHDLEYAGDSAVIDPWGERKTGFGGIGRSITYCRCRCGHS
ncbi:MAG: hypothetical protein NZ609_05955 [Acidimicrobiales bacterium]|nr:hypothetical protein [Acidimicrobiales bacterium]